MQLTRKYTLVCAYIGVSFYHKSVAPKKKKKKHPRGKQIVNGTNTTSHSTTTQHTNACRQQEQQAVLGLHLKHSLGERPQSIFLCGSDGIGCGPDAALPRTAHIGPDGAIMAPPTATAFRRRQRQRCRQTKLPQLLPTPSLIRFLLLPVGTCLHAVAYVSC